MDSNPSYAAQQRRYYSRGQPPNEHTAETLGGPTPYSQPHYARREHSDPGQSPWTPPVWPNNGLSRTSMLDSLGPQFPSLNEPLNVFDATFPQPAPWIPLSSSIPSGTVANLTLPFPAFDSIFTNRTSSAMMNPLTAAAPLSSSGSRQKILAESNDDGDDDKDEDEDDDEEEEEKEPHGATNLDPPVRSLKANALHKVAWGAKRDSETKILSPSEGNKRSANSSRTQPREPTSKNVSSLNKSDSDSGSNSRSKGRLNHDLTEKRYRNRLNDQFENVLSVLPARLIAESEGSIGGPDDRREKRVSKAEVLILAKAHISDLKRKQGELKAENRRLATRVKKFEEVWSRAGGNPPVP